MLRKLWLAVVVVALIAAATASTAVGGRAESVSFSWAFVGEGAATPPASDVVLACPDVPDGMWVRGTGTWTLFDDAGVKGVIQSMAHGTATDNLGGSYQWNYHQSIQPLADGVHSRVVDQFGLSGSGAAGDIHSHFIAVIEGTDLEETTSFELLFLRGDPFDCDPI
jgi:hypothetical protein